MARRWASSPHGGELGVADDAFGGVDVDVGVVEEAEDELLPQQAAYGGVDACFGDAAGADEFDDEFWALFAAELVGARVQGLSGPFGGGEVLDAPGSGDVGLAEDLGVGEQAPVGADDAGEAEFVAEQAGEDVLVEAEGDFFPAGTGGLAVVGHHLRGAAWAMAALNGARW